MGEEPPPALVEVWLEVPPGGSVTVPLWRPAPRGRPAWLAAAAYLLLVMAVIWSYYVLEILVITVVVAEIGVLVHGAIVSSEAAEQPALWRQGAGTLRADGSGLRVTTPGGQPSGDFAWESVRGASAAGHQGTLSLSSCELCLAGPDGARVLVAAQRMLTWRDERERIRAKALQDRFADVPDTALSRMGPPREPSAERRLSRVERHRD